MQTVYLSGYQLTKQNKDILEFGTWGSYGEQQLQVLHDGSWADMIITAVFVLPDDRKIRMLVESNIVKIPQEATSIPLVMNNPGKILFQGIKEGVRRNSTELIFLVKDHASIDGAQDSSNPSENAWEQYIAKVQEIVDQAVPPEGVVGQVLTKTADGSEWSDPIGGGTSENGATFIPSVSPEGIISWTNDKGKPNPGPVNIKGPAGKDGDAGPKGDTGAPGPAGADGKTPVKGVDYWTNADQKNIVNDVLQALPTWQGGAY